MSTDISVISLSITFSIIVYISFVMYSIEV